MGFLGYAAVAHGTGLEALHDAFGRLHLVHIDGLAAFGVEGEQAAQGVGPHVVVHQGGVLLEGLVVAGLGRMLQKADGQRVDHVVLGTGGVAHLVVAGGGKGQVLGQAQGVEGGGVALGHQLLQVLQANAAYAAGGVGEVLVHHVLAQAQDLEDLGALVGLQGRDAHLGGNLDHAGEHRAVVVGNGHVGVAVQGSPLGELADALVGQVGAHRAGAVAQQGGEVVHAGGLGAFQHHGYGGALLGAHQVLLHRGNGQQGGNGQVAFVHSAVAQNDHVGAVVVGLLNI